MSAPVRMYRLPGGQTDAQVALLCEFARANNIDPATVDGVTGFEVYLEERLIRWREHSGQAGTGRPRAEPLLVEPSPELLAALGVPSWAPRRRGVVQVDEEQLVRLLALPETWRVLALQPFHVRQSIGVLVEGPDLPECAPDAEPPFVEPPARAGAELHARLLPLIRAAIAGAMGRCEHPDPGGPIYDPVRPCPECAAAAVVELLAGPPLEVRLIR
jgi:hypothetical protein